MSSILYLLGFSYTKKSFHPLWDEKLRGATQFCEKTNLSPRSVYKGTTLDSSPNAQEAENEKYGKPLSPSAASLMPFLYTLLSMQPNYTT
jgi:hypothetical protein